MTNVIIYHNPNCSKSRQTLALLEKRSEPITVIEYLKTPHTAQELRDLFTLLAQDDIRAMMRVKDDLYQALNLAQATDDELFSAMAEHPKLMERPIVVYRNQAKIGRPPEQVLELFDHV